MLTSLAARLANSFSSTADGEMNSPFAAIATRCNGGTSWYRTSQCLATFVSGWALTRFHPESLIPETFSTASSKYGHHRAADAEPGRVGILPLGQSSHGKLPTSKIEHYLLWLYLGNLQIVVNPISLPEFSVIYFHPALGWFGDVHMGGKRQAR